MDDESKASRRRGAPAWATVAGVLAGGIASAVGCTWMAGPPPGAMAVDVPLGLVAPGPAPAPVAAAGDEPGDPPAIEAAIEAAGGASTTPAPAPARLPVSRYRSRPASAGSGW